MQTFEALVKKFEAYLQEHTPFPLTPENLYEPCRYFLSLGGKRVRPVLCLMSNELFGEISADAWHAAMGIELFHNFTLIHDDIMDKAPLRRGETTVHERNGLTAGILCGDVMNIFAYAALGRIQQNLPTLLQLFNQTAIEVCEGQQLDMDFESREDIRIEDYLHMIRLKTSVLLACSLQMGAIIGHASEEDSRLLYEFGVNLGLAFQLRDDYLDAFGAEAETGKQQGGDILAHKKTYLYLKALELANDLQRENIQQLQRVMSTEKVQDMLQMFRETGAEDACKEAVAQYSQQAFSALNSIQIEEDRKKPLRDLANYLLHRKS